ncbi:MAG: bifunctional oligoribonuclease/PAP phosphatase NrnA [Saprospirales bacterium]|nr:bifunctional oligoribonuclease/PAP phosphatase NrnA [Saprospirales bacterium]MBK8491917.1 bifunctional oligoribonuclease/PAP phosphatase NrnA [Saprospirales bacterium]
MEHLKELKAFLSIPKDIVITTHRNPDGDAVGSSLALFHYLSQMGHTVRVMAPSEYPDFLSWMPGATEILVFDVHTEQGTEWLQRADMIFVLDYNDLERVDRMGEVIAPLKCPKVMIDHHLFPDPFADYVLSDTTASSTCELIYDFMVMMGHLDRIDPKIADSLFTGILTDTGSFKYSTSSKLYRIVADLVDRGVDDVRLQDLIFNSMDEKHLRLLGHCLYNRMEILEEYHTGIITLTKEDYEKYSISRGDTEGIVNFMLKLKNVKVAAFIHEQPTITKLSLRSKGDFSVQEIAKMHFKGGGHRNASGGSSYAGLKATVKKFKSLLPNYKTQLDNA